MAGFEELEIPSPAPQDSERAVEFIRFWVTGNRDYVALNSGIFNPKDEARQWGFILADIAKHAIHAMQLNDASMGSSDQLLAEIEAGFSHRVKTQTEFIGQLGERN
jgi:hypothetical protein